MMPSRRSHISRTRWMLVSCLALVPLCFGATASGAVPTARIIYTPFDASGAVRADLAKVTRSGECGGASLKSDRKDTWRCFAGNRRSCR